MAVFCALTVFLAYKLNIWLDEAYTLKTTEGDISSVIRKSLYFELQPPLYFLLLHWWRLLNGSVFFARLFSLACILLTIVITPFISQRYASKTNINCLTIYMTASPFLVWAATEIRCYALVILLSSCLLILFYDCYLLSKKYRSVYILIAVMSLYTQYYMGFLLFANFVALVTKKKWEESWLYVKDMVIVATLFSPMILVLGAQVKEHTEMSSTADSIVQAGKLVYWRLQNFLLYFPEDISRGVIVTSVYDQALLGLALLLVYLVYSRKNISHFIEKSLMNCVAVITYTTIVIFIVIVRCVVPETVFHLKHLAVLFIPFTVWWLNLFAEENRKTVVYSLLSFYVLYCGLILSIQYKDLQKPGNMKNVAKYLNEEYSGTKRIAVFPATSKLTLDFYTRGDFEIVAIPREQTLDKYNLEKQKISNREEVEELINSCIDGKGTMILVYTSVSNILGVNLNREILEASLRSSYKIIRSDNFNKYTKVLQLKKSNQNLLKN